MRLRKWQVQLGGIVFSLFLAAGCVETMLLSAGAMAGIGSYKWMEGTMEKDYPRPMADCWNACLAACKTLNLKIASQAYNPLESKIEANQPDGTAVKIHLIARPNNITTVKVRFGMMGNQDYSAYFHRRVMESLGVGTG